MFWTPESLHIIPNILREIHMDDMGSQLELCDDSQHYNRWQKLGPVMLAAGAIILVTV